MMNPVLATAAELWDELADFEGGVEGSRRHLMSRLCALLGGSNAVWVVAVRTATDREDPLLGWRVRAVSYLHRKPADAAAIAELSRRWHEREVDPLNLLQVRGAGTFRVVSLRRDMPRSWFDCEFYRELYAGRGISDALSAGFPVTEDAESHFVFHRDRHAAPFGDRELALAATTLRGLKWMHRSWMLARGLLAASKPLSPAERRILGHLLSDAQEKEIAVAVELAPVTVHDYVKSIYRKFGVSNRAGLMSLWLHRAAPSSGSESAPPP
jgi:DNA-binding CsgD family transcriptional regulator